VDSAVADMQLAGGRRSRWQGALMGISGGDTGCLARNYDK
jgi:hypothetical protein